MRGRDKERPCTHRLARARVESGREKEVREREREKTADDADSLCEKRAGKRQR